MFPQLTLTFHGPIIRVKQLLQLGFTLHIVAYLKKKPYTLLSNAFQRIWRQNTQNLFDIIID